MPIARRVLVDADSSGFYHCVSRCVRRAYLCGDRFEHRRGWIRERLEVLTEIFAIDVVSFAVMSNHMHVLVWTDPERASGWSDRAVARRWMRLCPGSVPVGVSEETAVAHLTQDLARVAKMRDRLSSLSWFMRYLKEPIARRANREDNVRGAFWESRFKSYRILDEAGLLTCSVYIDLNPIHAGMAQTPEQSYFTSVRERIEELVAHRRVPRNQRRRTTPNRESRWRGIRKSWLVPFGTPSSRSANTARRTITTISAAAYVALVDAIGRIIRGDKRGSIPASAKPILSRLGMEPESWVQSVGNGARRLWGTTVGRVDNLVNEACRRRTRWVVNPFGDL